MRKHLTTITSRYAFVDLTGLFVLALRNEELRRLRDNQPEREDDGCCIGNIEPVQVPPIFSKFVIDGKKRITATSINHIEHCTKESSALRAYQFNKKQISTISTQRGMEAKKCEHHIKRGQSELNLNDEHYKKMRDDSSENHILAAPEVSQSEPNKRPK